MPALIERANRMRSTVDPTLVAFREPARLAWRLWLDALRRDRRARVATAVLGAMAAIMLFGVLLAPVVSQPDAVLRAPSFAHPFGTDARGRDLLRVIIAGTPRTLGAAGLGTLGAATLGVALGALSGYLRGGTDVVIHRLLEVLQAVPSLLLVLVVQALYRGSGSAALILIVIVTRWSDVAVVVRADVLRAVQLDHVTAARALGASPGRVLARHIMPEALSSAGVLIAFGLGAIVALEVTIAMVGIGEVHPLAWGALLAGARVYPDAWWLIAFPTVFVALTIGASVLLAEAMRDALDPQLRHKSDADAFGAAGQSGHSL